MTKFSKLDEIFPHQDRQVRDYIIHPEYYKGGLFNDVALLFLAEPLEIAENVNTVCLPAHGDNFDGSRCFASGWGKDLFGKEGKYQVFMRFNKFMFDRCVCFSFHFIGFVDS